MNNKMNYEVIEATENTDAHIHEFAKDNLIDLTITKDYNYRITNPIMKVLSFLLNIVAIMVLPLVLFVNHGLIIKGRRNLRGLKTGAVSVSNHVLMLDGPIVAQTLFPKRVIFHSSERTFKIPFIRHLVKMLGCIPIPDSISARPGYIKATNEFLAEGKIIQIYPEASMWPQYNKIRPFKTGAFHFAVKNNVPIIPISINFRQPKGILKHFKVGEKLVTVHIGKPIYHNNELPFKESVEELLKRSHHNLTRMNKYFKILDKQVVEQLELEKEEII